MKLTPRLILCAGTLLLSVTAHAICTYIPKTGIPPIFKGTTCQATSTNVIAATVPSITPQNTVVQIPMPPNVPPPSLGSLTHVGRPPGPAVGLLYAIKGDNLSQMVPTSPPPPVPQPVCSCGGYPGTVKWSGWDNIGWQTTPGGCYACPPPPQPPATSGIPGNFCPPQGCAVTQTGALCNSVGCYVGNGQIAVIGANGYKPVLTNQTVSQANASLAASTVASFAQATGRSSCATSQVTGGGVQPIESIE